MARTELPNGVILPAEYSDDWYEDMTSNLTKLDDVIGSDSEKLNADGVYFLRMSSAALTNGGTGNFSDLNSSYKIKTGDLILDSGRKLYQVVSVDSANETFTVGNSLFKVTAESDLAPVAESGDYGDLDNRPDLNPYDQHLANTDIHVTAADKQKWNNQTYVFRYSSTALTASSTNSNALLDNADNLKVGDKVIDSSGVLFSITAIDTQNSTFTIGTALIDLAQDSDVVHTSGNETVGGVKTFSNNTYITSLNFTNEVPSPSSSSSSILPIITTITYGDGSPSVQARLNLRITADGVKSLYPHENNLYNLGLLSRRWSDFFSYHGNFAGQYQGDEYSGNARTNLTLLANRDTTGQSGCLIDTYRENTTQGTGSHIIGFGIKENSVRYEGCRFSWLWNNYLNGYSFSIIPTLQGANQAVEHNLGLSTDKWDKINGLEPSSLGMPDLSNGIDISGYITVPNTHNTYTPTVNGWISVVLKSTSGALALFMYQGDLSSANYSATSLPNETEPCVMCSLPVIKNVAVSIDVKGSNAYVVSAKFYPCLGNV